MNQVKANDLKYGLSAEERVKEKLDGVFGTLHNNNDENKYAPIDFMNDKYAVEYKRRRIRFGQYPTIMVNISKIVKGREYVAEGKRVFYVWECNNGSYY